MRLMYLKARTRLIGAVNRLARTVPWPLTMTLGYALLVMAVLALVFPHLWLIHGGWGPWWFFILALLPVVLWAMLMLQGLANVRRGRVTAAFVLLGAPLWVWAWVEWTMAGLLARWVLEQPL
ncbi:MAG: hypothetical protein DIU69_10920, partial [Bacillota bacterium]